MSLHHPRLLRPTLRLIIKIYVRLRGGNGSLSFSEGVSSRYVSRHQSVKPACGTVVGRWTTPSDPETPPSSSPSLYRNASVVQARRDVHLVTLLLMSTGTANVLFSSNLSELLTDALVNGASLFVAIPPLLAC